MTLVLERFIPQSPLVLERMGPAASSQELAHVVAVIGPPGSAGANGNAGAQPMLGDNLSNQINGVTNVFQLAHPPAGGRVALFFNTARQGVAFYAVAGDQLTLSFTPVVGDELYADYFY